jgi:hypothetical protein
MARVAGAPAACTRIVARHNSQFRPPAQSSRDEPSHSIRVLKPNEATASKFNWM